MGYIYLAQDMDSWSTLVNGVINTVKCKAILLQSWTGCERFRSLRLPDFKTIGTWRWWCCQLYAPAAFTPRKHSWYSFLLEA